ncbi:MAG: GNAT family N-acetyltransferase [Pseudomonadota bacterium]
MQDLKTKRLTLRAWSLADRAALPAILADPEVMAYSDAGPLSVVDMDAWLRCRVSTKGQWAITHCGAVIGYVALSAARVPEGTSELGFRLARSAWGHGYATEAVQAVLDALAPTPGRVSAIVDPANAASVRVLAKVGFRYARPIMFAGYDHPDHLYLLESTMRALKEGSAV